MKKDVGTAWQSVKTGCARIRSLLVEERLFTLETALLFFPVFTVFLGCAGFLIGRPVTGLWFYGALSATAALLMLGAASRRDGLRRIALFAAIVAACAFCASLFLFIDGLGNTDSILYHAPGAMLMAEGWNPVLCSSVEAVRDRYAMPANGVWTQHIALLPKMNWVFAASAFRATGSMTMGTLSCLLLMISAGWCAFRFFRIFFRANSRVTAALFAAGIAFSAKAANSLAGCNDYYLYAGLVILIFSLFAHLKTGSVRDLVFAALALPWCWCVKMGGIPWSFMILAVFFAVLAGRVLSGRATIALFTAPVVCVVCAVIAGFVIGFSPYITNWVNYSSPFYPEHTFSAAVKALPEHDITGTLTGNADAESMGHLSRFAYAWISKEGTLACLRLWHGKGFNPEFYVFGGVEGMGGSMRLLLIISFAGLLAARRSLLDAVYALLLISVIFVPVKFIGYARYTPQVWVLPFIGCFAAACLPGAWAARRPPWLRRGLFFGVSAAMGCFTLLAAGRCGVMVLCKLANEESRLAAIESAREKPVEAVCVVSQFHFEKLMASPQAAESEAARCWYGEYALQRFDVPYRRLLSSKEAVETTGPRLFMLFENLLFLRTLDPADYTATLTGEITATLTSRRGFALPVGTVLSRLPGYICRATAFNLGNLRRGLPGAGALEAASARTTRLPEY